MALQRRSFLKLSLLGSGGLLIGIPACDFGQKKEPVRYTRYSPFIEIGTDGSITIVAKNPEIGQGVFTSLPMIIAEELCVLWEKVKVIQVDYNEELYGGQWAGGSLAVRLNWDGLRKAGAMVKEIFVLAGAQMLEVDRNACKAQSGQVIHEASGRSIAYEQLLTKAAEIPLPEDVDFKKSEDYTIIGRPKRAGDIEKIVSGNQLFGIDQHIDGMLYASILKCPFFKGGIQSFDDSETRKVIGVVDIISLSNIDYGGYILAPNSPNFVNGIAVLATDTWAAFQGKKALKAEWKPISNESSDEIFESYRNALTSKGEVTRSDGNLKTAFAQSTKIYTATYEVPFLAHVPMEPMNCTAHFRGEICEVWAPTQNPEALRDGLVKLFNVKPENAIIHLVRCGGGFGRRYYVDYAMEAALLSKMTGKPIKVTWTREDDVRHDLYRPAAVHKLTACLKKGTVTGLHYQKANASRKTYLKREGSPSGTELDEYEFPGGIVPNLLYTYHHVENNVPLGQWRAVSHSSNVFAMASFLDELAYINQEDPADFLLRFLGDKNKVPVAGRFELDLARLKKVITKVVDKSGWGKRLLEGSGMGIAASYNQGSFVAEVAEVSVLENELKVHNITAVLDCGLVINPSGAIHQVEGGIIEGLCAALYGEVNIKNAHTIQSNFHDYRWLRIGEIPQINVHFIESNLSPRGLGEPPLPPVAPAICNAIFAASGKRIRRLPLKDQLKKI